MKKKEKKKTLRLWMVDTKEKEPGAGGDQQAEYILIHPLNGQMKIRKQQRETSLLNCF